MNTKQPFMPLFFSDLLGSTAEWEGEEVSLYLTLLGHEWTLGSLPPEAAKLCRLVRWERKLFDRCWRQVSEKFVERAGRLFNARLEEHRSHSQELSSKNSTAGKAGANARWRKDGERHKSANGEGVAERQCETHGVTNSNPNHTIPNQTPSLRSGVSARARSPAIEKPPEIIEPEAQIRWQAFERLKAVYPAGIYRSNAWISAERAWCQLLDSGESEAEISQLVTDYAAQQQAAGNVGTQFVLNPVNFFANGAWRGPFPLPAAKLNGASTPRPRLRTADEIEAEERAHGQHAA